LALVSSAYVHAASAAAPALPVISITQVETDDPSDYAARIARINEVMKSKFGVEQFLRLYLGDAAGEDLGTVFAVTRGDSFATVMKHADIYQTDPALAEMRADLARMRELESRLLLKAARFDGVHPNAALYNSYANVTDEAGYLKALGELRALFDAHGLTDVKINAYRVISGRSDYTHLVSLNTPSSGRLAALLDSIATEAWAMDWIAGSAKYRSIVRNGTFREISR
jgi:hypothetical protein